jgi:hypothetical protein
MRLAHAVTQAQQTIDETEQPTSGADTGVTMVGSLTCDNRACSLGIVVLSLFSAPSRLRNQLPIACPGCGDDSLVNYIAPAAMAPECDRRALSLPVPA